MIAICQCLNYLTVKKAPSRPIPANREVAIPLNFLGKISETKVISAPNSPARPTPATKRSSLYQDTDSTSPQRILAREPVIAPSCRPSPLPE